MLVGSKGGAGGLESRQPGYLMRRVIRAALDANARPRFVENRNNSVPEARLVGQEDSKFRVACCSGGNGRPCQSSRVGPRKTSRWKVDRWVAFV